MNNITFFDHTADIGMRLERSSVEELFRDAALGMFQIIAPNTIFKPCIEYKVAVDGANLEELLVNWLSDLNFFFQTRQYVPVEMVIIIHENKLTATIQGDVVDSSVHNIEIEVKAVTYHKIYVRQTDGQWHAQIIFDI